MSFASRRDSSLSLPIFLVAKHCFFLSFFSQLFPSSPPSHESSPSIQFSFDSPSQTHSLSHASRGRDASSISQASTTAVVSEADIAQAEREKFADFRVDDAGEGEDGLGLELRKGRKNLKRFEQDEAEGGEGRGRAGLSGSRSLRDGLKTDVSLSFFFWSTRRSATQRRGNNPS